MQGVRGKSVLETKYLCFIKTKEKSASLKSPGAVVELRNHISRIRDILIINREKEKVEMKINYEKRKNGFMFWKDKFSLLSSIFFYRLYFTKRKKITHFCINGFCGNRGFEVCKIFKLKRNL